MGGPVQSGDQGGVERRRSPRIAVDIEAELHMHGSRPARGIIQNLSFVGSLFVPERPVRLDPNVQGMLRFAIPNGVRWVEPKIEVRRVMTFPRPRADDAQAIGFEFMSLSAEQERSIAAVCMDWATHRVREYPLAAPIAIQGGTSHRHISVEGRAIVGSRSRIRMTLADRPNLPIGASVTMSIGATQAKAEVEDVRTERGSTELVLRLEGWGRDFFLHEARRNSMGTSTLRRDPLG